MPAVNVSFESTVRAVRAERPPPSLADYSTVVATPLGLALVEIQGELSIPREKPAGLSVSEQELFTRVPLPAVFTDDNCNSNHSDNDSGAPVDVDAVRFGRLELDESLKRATLFISTTQRLVGTVEKIDPPLGVLKVVHTDRQDADDARARDAPAAAGKAASASAPSRRCEVLDIVRTKIVFRQRPLPIM